MGHFVSFFEKPPNCFTDINPFYVPTSSEHGLFLCSHILNTTFLFNYTHSLVMKYYLVVILRVFFGGCYWDWAQECFTTELQNQLFLFWDRVLLLWSACLSLPSHWDGRCVPLYPAHCSFDLHFPNVSWCWLSCHEFVDCVHSSWCPFKFFAFIFILWCWGLNMLRELTTTELHHPASCTIFWVAFELHRRSEKMTLRKGHFYKVVVPI